MFNKEFIWPAVIVIAFRHASTALAFAKDGAQSPPNPAVHACEHTFPAVFEIAEPADKTWIQPGNYVVQTVPISPLCDPAYFVLKFVKALSARVMLAFLEPIAEKFKAFFRRIDCSCLFRVERQTGLLRPFPYRFQGLFSLLTAAEHPVGMRVHALGIVFNNLTKSVRFRQFRL